MNAADCPDRSLPREKATGIRFELVGAVQGVGMRPWVARLARALRLTGHVSNRGGAVVVVAFGPESALQQLAARLGQLQSGEPARDGGAQGAARSAPEAIPGAPAGARLEQLLVFEESSEAPTSFEIVASENGGASTVPLPADLPVCDACLGEVFSPSTRFFAYAFTSCTNCGPRYSLVEGLPFDRCRTALSEFPYCEECAREVRDPASRRYHAQTSACPGCGPRLWLAAGREEVSRGPAAMHDGATVIQRAAERLRRGEVLAVKGNGAFHLVCDSANEEAVRALRRRKRREHKPFAVLVQDLVMAEQVARVSNAARLALASAARPIVLLPPEPASRLAPSVRGDSARVGVMLAETPLQHLLLREFAGPLVMTSANLSGEPALIDNLEAAGRLLGVADAFLLHDRRIVRRVEDSVVQLSEDDDHGAPWDDAAARPGALASPSRLQILRRSRGYVPLSLRLPAPSPEPVLAVGGDQKNTVCVVIGARAFVGAHLGDVQGWSSEQALGAEVEALLRLLGVRPRIVAHDWHPSYLTTCWAQQYASSIPGSTLHAVPHHVAHLLSALGEHHLGGPALGLAFDGTGFGHDGTAWGGEVLWLDDSAADAGWRRIASFRATPLPGGEVALRQVWRQAWSWGWRSLAPPERAALSGLSCFRTTSEPERRAITSLLETGTCAPGARGVGRLFDAVGALVLGRANASFEGEVAMALEDAASAWEGPAVRELEPYPWCPPRELALPSERSPLYPMTVPSAMGESAVRRVQDLDAAHEIDFRPTVAAVLSEILAGRDQRGIAARFHQTVAAAAWDVVRRVVERRPGMPIVLGGGAWQNRRLQATFRRYAARVPVVHGGAVPCNDGGLSLGQAWATVLALRAQVANVASSAPTAGVEQS